MKDTELPLESHLHEIQKRAGVVLFFFILFTGLSFYYIQDILEILKSPAGEKLGVLAVFSPTAAILSFIKIAFFCGAVGTLPVLLYEVWMFILPALHERFAKMGAFFIVTGTSLFLLGGVFSFCFLLPASLKFLLSVGEGKLQFIISLDSYVSFVLILLLGGGVVFEMPILTYLLARLGVLTAKKMISGWRVALVGILVFSAILTPTPDVVNMMLLSIPMLGLYLLSILVAHLVSGAKPKISPHLAVR